MGKFLDKIDFQIYFNYTRLGDYLNLNLYRNGGAGPVFLGDDWGEVKFEKGGEFKALHLVGHFFGEDKANAISPYVFPLLREYAKRRFPQVEKGDFFEYVIKKGSGIVMKGELFAPGWTCELHQELQNSADECEEDIPF